MSNGWIAMHRGELIDSLQEMHPNAFLLISQIARRARRESCLIRRLEKGEAQIGDFKKAGIDSEMKYRTAKKTLLALGLITCRVTNKGTIAKLSDTRVYSISKDDRNGQDNTNVTSGQQADNERVTSNKKVRKKEGKKEDKKTPQPPRGEWEPDTFQTTINACYKRRQSTKWADAEIRAYKKIDQHPEDLALMVRYCNPETGSKFRRKDLKTLLNNWQGELDRARAWETTTNGAAKTFQSGRIEIGGRKGYIVTRKEIEEFYGDKDELPLQHEQ